MYTRKAAKKIYFYIIFYHEEISGVVGRKSEQCLALAESICNAIGQQDRPIRKALRVRATLPSPETSLVLLS